MTYKCRPCIWFRIVTNPGTQLSTELWSRKSFFHESFLFEPMNQRLLDQIVGLAVRFQDRVGFLCGVSLYHLHIQQQPPMRPCHKDWHRSIASMSMRNKWFVVGSLTLDWAAYCTLLFLYTKTYEIC